MNFPKFNHQETFSPSKQPQPQLNNLQQAFTNLQTHCSGLFQDLSKHPLLNPNPSSLKTHLDSTISNLGNHAKHAFEAGISRFNHAGSSSFGKNPVWARIPNKNEAQLAVARQSGAVISPEVIEERLAGVPVYALSNSSEEFVLVSGVKTGKSVGLFCFKKEDAETLLEQMKSMDPSMRRGSRVVAVALNKVASIFPVLS